jgi:putative membrane protein
VTEPPLKPLVILRPEDDAGPTPADVPPVPEAVPDAGPPVPLRRRGSALSRLAVWAFGLLFSFVLSVAAWDFVTALLSRNPLLGGVATALVGFAVLAALALAVRELAAVARVGRIDALRQAAGAAALAGDVAAARAVVQGVAQLYAARPETAEARRRLVARGAEQFDADGLLGLAETELLAPLDQAARREVEAAARQVATVTALVPLALADVATALYANLRMVRRIAELYGGRSGMFGSLRLVREVMGHLIATGALAVGDDLIHSVAGGGILSKISRRFGEGVVNGALTARVGVAAMEVCRPLPFRAAPKPKVSNLLTRALAGLFEGRAGDGPRADPPP